MNPRIGSTVLIPILLFAVTALPVVQADYTVHVVDTPITNRSIVAGKPLPDVCKPGRVLTVSACRGEYEPASFVVVTDQPLKGVEIEVGALKGSQGTLDADAVDVRIVWHWVAGSRIGDLHPARNVLVKNDSMLMVKPMPTEEYPARSIIVAPNGLRDATQLQPVDIDDLKQFWITVQVPREAKSGSYRAGLKIKPQNAPPAELTLNLEVYPFELLAPMMENSIYYPVTLVAEGSPDWRTGKWVNTAWITPKQYLLELENMVAHGLTNPNIYTGVQWDAEGAMDFDNFEKVLALREQAGIGPGVPLYAMSNVAEPISKKLSVDEKKQRVEDVRMIMDWARQRGYPDLYWAGMDEASGSRLVGERDSFQAVLDGGGKTWVACSAGFYNLVSDVLSLPVVMCNPNNVPLDRLQESLSLDHPRMLPLDDHEGRARAKARLIAEYEQMVSVIPLEKSGYRAVLDSTHRRGNRVFAYAFPWTSAPVPETHRRTHGLALWQMGFDGSMNWAYTHIKGSLGPAAIRQGGYGYVIRTEDGVLDKLRWEGFREGVDDVRYLTTLIDVLGRVAGTYGKEPLVAETLKWLTELNVRKADLNATRLEMARRIIALRELGGHVKPLIEIDPRKLKGAPANEEWDIQFSGDGLPDSEIWKGHPNSMKFHIDLPPGFLLAVGNPGGEFHRPVSGCTKATGWTVEWGMKAETLHQLPAPLDLVSFRDDTNAVALRYTKTSVTLKDHLPDSGATLDLKLDEYHLYRLVRQPGSDTVELYIDNRPEPALAFAPAACELPHCNVNNINRVQWGNSVFQARWNFFRYHKGATIPRN